MAVQATEWLGATAIGGRSENQDRYRCHTSRSAIGPTHRIGVVCDGIGAGARSGEAAERACAGFVEGYHALQPLPAPERMKAAADIANGTVRDLIEEGGTDINTGTTLAAAAISPEGLTWVSVGDSRIYHWTPDGGGSGRLTRLNPLHNGHRANILTSALSGARIPMIAVPQPAWQDVEPGDVVLVASDGLATLSDEETAEIVSRTRENGPEAESTAEALLAAVLERAKARQDNVTIVGTVIHAG